MISTSNNRVLITNFKLIEMCIKSRQNIGEYPPTYLNLQKSHVFSLPICSSPYSFVSLQQQEERGGVPLFLAPASERGLFLPSVIVIRSEWSCKMAFFSFSSGPNDLSTVALLHSRLGLVTRKNHNFCFFKPQKGQYYTFHVRPSVRLFHNLCMLNTIGPFPPLANGLHSLAIRRRGVFSYRIYTPKTNTCQLGNISK